MNRGSITLSRREQQRAHVLAQVLEGRLTVPDAARLMGVSSRHAKRLLARVRAHGLAALAHGNRGRPPARRWPEPVRERLLTLARTTYAGCNDCHFTELLAEQEHFSVSRPTVQRWLRAAGIGSPRKRRPPRHRRRRERMPQAGLLVQMDGSPHAWLEARGPRLTLQAAVDDATGEVLEGVFRLQEDSHGYLLLVRRLIQRYGVPAAVYTDRHGMVSRDATALSIADQLAGQVTETQIGRALRELGITWIPASSPQAKGRIERLLGTFQDRLVSELRLAGACTIEQAQQVFDRFRPRYNARFARAALNPEPAWQPVPSATDLQRICSFKYRRTVAQDNTLHLDGRVVQLAPGPQGRSYAGARVDVYAHLDGTLSVYLHGRRLAAKRLPDGHQPRRPHRPVTVPAGPPNKAHVPPPDHPWRAPRPSPRLT